MLGARISEGSGDWSRVGMRSWRMRSAIAGSRSALWSTTLSLGRTMERGDLLRPNLTLRSSGGLFGPLPGDDVVFA